MEAVESATNLDPADEAAFDERIELTADAVLKILYKQVAEAARVCAEHSASTSVVENKTDTSEAECVPLRFEKGYAIIEATNSGVSDDNMLRWKARCNPESTQRAYDDPRNFAVGILKICSREDITVTITHDVEAAADKSPIKIAKRKECQRGFSGDEVLVDLQQNAIITVTRAAVDDDQRNFICNARDIDGEQVGSVLPNDSVMPRHLTLMRKTEAEHAIKNRCLCVYSIDRDIVRFNKFVPITQSNEGKYYKVKLIKWKPEMKYPIGLIVGECETSGLNSLHTSFCIKTRFTKDQLSEADELYRHFKPVIAGNLTPVIEVFTIDSKGAVELDDAISLQSCGDYYTIGVHISNVAHFIAKKSCLDAEAYRRVMSAYSSDRREPLIRMIPKKLSTDLLSLLPGKERLAISFFHCVDMRGKPLDSAVPRHEVKWVKSIKKWDKVKAEEAMRANGPSDLHQLYRLMIDGNDDFRTKGDGLVQYLMERTKVNVARFLYERYPDCTPLHVQMASLKAKPTPKRTTRTMQFPRRSNDNGATAQDTQNNRVNILLTQWEEVTKSLTEMDLDRVRQIIKTIQESVGQTCDVCDIGDNNKYGSLYQCSKDIAAHIKVDEIKTRCTSPMRRYMDIVAQRILIAAIDGATTPPYTPQELREICGYCTLYEYQLGKYQLQANTLECAVALKNRTSVAFPVVENVSEWQMVVRFPSFAGQPPETQNIGHNVLGLSQTPAFDSKSGILKLQWKLIIYDVNGGDQRGSFNRRNKERAIPLRNAVMSNIVKVPVEQWNALAEATGLDDLKANVDTIQSCIVSQTTANRNEETSFDMEVTSESLVTCDGSEPIDHTVPLEMTIRRGTILQIQMTAAVVRDSLQPSIQLLCLQPKLHICIEHQSNPLRCFAKPRVDKASKPTYSSLDEYVQLWSDVVAMDAAETAVQQQRGITIHGIHITWTGTVDKPAEIRGNFKLANAFCVNRQIHFNPAGPVTFSDDTQGKHSKRSAGCNDDEAAVLKKERDYDFLCVRYIGDINEEIARKAFDSKCVDYSTVSWVGHCVSVGVVNGKDATTVYLRLQDCSSTFPQELFSRDTVLPCTVEVMSKGIPNMRRENALNSLRSAAQFVQEIATGKQPPFTGDITVDESVFQPLKGFEDLNQDQKRAVTAALSNKFTLIQGPPGTGKTTTGAYLAYKFAEKNQKNDENQKVLVCGPTNASVDVMAEAILKAGVMCPRLLRVYGEEIEQDEFPLPWVPKHHRRAKLIREASSEKLRRITMHFRIRGELNPNSKTILQLEEEFKNNRRAFSREDVAKYRSIVSAARQHELCHAQIILCTCTSAGSPKMSKIPEQLLTAFSTELTEETDVASGESDSEATAVPDETSVMWVTDDVNGNTGAELETAAIPPVPAVAQWQIIIDEAGMCTEPDTMIPLVTHSQRIEKLVLIGDHKQLQPVILCREAVTANLDVSLFERIANRTGVTVLLTEQYRMHKVICYFPSNQFYDNRLHCANDRKQSVPSKLSMWPGGSKTPVAFVDVRGFEKTQFVSTSDAAEMSKCNAEEAEYAVKLAHFLLNNPILQRPPGSGEAANQKQKQPVAILTFYRSQRTLLEKIVNEEHSQCCRDKLHISTVVLSQGNEWSHVILSCVRSVRDHDEGFERQPDTTSHLFFGWKLRYLGFLCNYNQLNVAITRAKDGLIIIGNQRVLDVDEVWSKLIEHYRKLAATDAGTTFLKRCGIQNVNVRQHRRKR